MKDTACIAIDLGATSGRVIFGKNETRRVGDGNSQPISQCD